VDLAWKNGKPASASVRNVNGDSSCKVRLGDSRVEFKVRQGKAVSFDANLKLK